MKYFYNTADRNFVEKTGSQLRMKFTGGFDAVRVNGGAEITDKEAAHTAMSDANNNEVEFRCHETWFPLVGIVTIEERT